MSTTSVGRGGEALAKEYLEARGYQPLRQNYRSGPREIDLIMRYGETIVFIEVKARTKTQFGTPAEFVTPAKRKLLTLAAEQPRKRAGVCATAVQQRGAFPRGN